MLEGVFTGAWGQLYDYPSANAANLQDMCEKVISLVNPQRTDNITITKQSTMDKAYNIG